MSHRSPTATGTGTYRPTTTTSSVPPTYSHLHHHATHEDHSSDDDDIDPRWTNKRVVQAAQQQQQKEQPPYSPTSSQHSGPEGASFTNTTTGGLSSSPRTHHPNFPRKGYTATPNPLDTSVGTNGLYQGQYGPYSSTTGALGGAGSTTTESNIPPPAREVEQQWKKGMGELETRYEAQKEAQGGFTTIPAPQVDLTGMTEEQRELLEYYQARLDAFDRERVDFLHRLDEMAGNSREKHSLKWELHKKDEQLMDLQKALSDAHVFLYEERAQVLKLTAENDRLKIQELEDRQRLEHLLALTQPINQEVTYFRECRPEKLTKNYPGQRDDIYASQKDMSTVENALDSPRRQVLQTSRVSGASDVSGPNNASILSHSQSASQFGSQTARRTYSTGGVSKPVKKKVSANLRPVVRTIYLPNENIDILKQIIASLRAQLTEQHTLFEQRIQALQEDRAIREQETAEVQRKANEHMQELAKELKAVNELNKMTTRDYLELRHAAQLAERKLKERASQLSQQQFELQKHLKAVEAKAAMSETALQNENASYVSMFRQQTAATEEDLAIMKAQYAATQDLYEKRIRYLEGRISTIKTKLATVSERRALELEGYTTDITHLREKVRKLEQNLIHFKAHQVVGMNDDSSNKKGRYQSEEKTNDSAGGPMLPGRVSATFELLGEDVRNLQSELTQMARKINTT